MKIVETIGDLTGDLLFIEKLGAGYNPIPSFSQWDLYFIYRYGKIPMKRKKLPRVRKSYSLSIR